MSTFTFFCLVLTALAVVPLFGGLVTTLVQGTREEDLGLVAPTLFAAGAAQVFTWVGLGMVTGLSAPELALKLYSALMF